MINWLSTFLGNIFNGGQKLTGKQLCEVLLFLSPFIMFIITLIKLFVEYLIEQWEQSEWSMDFHDHRSRFKRWIDLILGKG